MKLDIAILCAVGYILFVSSGDAAFFGSDCGNNATHSYYIGNKSALNSLLYTKHVLEESRFLRKISVDVTFPLNGTRPLGQIKYIEALDQTHEGTGGCVFIRNGGVGTNYVTFHIKSQRNYGLNFYLFVYGLYYP